MKTWRDNYTVLNREDLFVERIRLEEDLFEELDFVKGLLNEDTTNKRN